jgi:hypothetical protein
MPANGTGVIVAGGAGSVGAVVAEGAGAALGSAEVGGGLAASAIEAGWAIRTGFCPLTATFSGTAARTTAVGNAAAPAGCTSVCHRSASVIERTAINPTSKTSSHELPGRRSSIMQMMPLLCSASADYSAKVGFFQCEYVLGLSLPGLFACGSMVLFSLFLVMFCAPRKTLPRTTKNLLE